MYAGIWEIDLHGKNEYQARVTLDAALRRVRPGTYRIRVIHGHHGGTALRELVRRGSLDKTRPTRLVRASLGNDAGVVGAAMLCDSI